LEVEKYVMSTIEPLRILLVDDHVLFRKGLAALLAARQDMEVIGEAGDGLEAIARARETVPDVILMDIHMPECDGLEAVRIIKREMPHVHIIMLTVSDDDCDLFAAIKNRAEGYLLKNLEPYQLFDMLEGVRQGEAAISGTLAAKILQEFRRLNQSMVPKPEVRDELTPREVEVLERVVEGATNKEIAEALVVTENTVKIHLHNILEKLHLQNRIQAAVYAVREGLLDDSSQTQ
jgi:DNA-binding NarL/FixJ family response regulator